MANRVPADPSLGLLPDNQKTPMSYLRARNFIRTLITPLSCHVDDPIPPVAPGFVPPMPDRVDFDNPPAALLQLMRVECGFENDQQILMAAQAAIVVCELASNRRMHYSLSHRPEFGPQRLHEVYATFTRGCIAYCCYCVGRISWNSGISKASPTIALLATYDDDAYAAACAFGRYIVRQYPRFDEDGGDYDMRLQFDNRSKGLLHYNLQHFFDKQRDRLKCGGIHSAAWIANQVRTNQALNRNCTHGMLYQHVLLIGRITGRLDKYLEREINWHLTPAQRGLVQDLEDSKIYAD